MVKSAQQGREVYEKITKVTDRFLDVALDYIGHVPYDDYVIKAIRKQQAIVDAFPRSKAAMAYKTLAEKIEKWPLPTAAGGHMEFFVERLIRGSGHDTEAIS
jgi:flagellar biosynthesis protein FlhG